MEENYQSREEVNSKSNMDICSKVETCFVEDLPINSGSSNNCGHNKKAKEKIGREKDGEIPIR